MPKQRYNIQEIFYSLQGEGRHKGKPVVFVRFNGCNLACLFCDQPQSQVDAEMAVSMTAAEIAAEIKRVAGNCQSVVLTGGEPMLQVDDELIDLLLEGSLWVGLETNGTRPIISGFDHVTVSPKAGTSLWKGCYRPGVVDEVRVPIERGQTLVDFPRPFDIPAADRYLSPIWGDPETLKWTIELCKKEPEWSLSVQMHKLLGIV